MRAWRAVVVLLGITVASSDVAAAQGSDAALLERARRLLREVPLIDSHNDLPTALIGANGGDLSKLDPDGPLPQLDTDFPRLAKGGIGAQFFAAYVASSYIESGGAQQAREQIALIRKFIDASPRLELAKTADDIVRIHKAGKIASLIGIEGGHAIEGSLERLREFYDLGVRYITLTHSGTTPWADAATDKAKHGGLSSFGEEVVREMNRLGIMVDISHVSDATMSDALRVSRAPVIFSHSSARALADHVRNVPDSILAKMPANGGVVMVNLFPGFINRTAAKQAANVLQKEQELNVKYPNDPDRAAREFVTWLSTFKTEDATLAEVADHIDHIRKVAGVDHVGLGADYGAVPQHPLGLEDVSRFPYLIAELLRRGWSDDDVKKFMGLNMLRVMRTVEQRRSDGQTG